MGKQTGVDRDATNELSRNVLENLLEGCQVISPDYRYLYVNEAVARHGKTTREALLGRTMMEVYPDIEQSEMFATLRQCMEERVAQQMDNEFTFPDGSKGWFQLRFEPVPEGVAILSVDITQMKQTEEDLRRITRAQKSLSRANKLLVRARNERSFVEDVCRLIVEECEHAVACVRLENSEEVTFVANRPGVAKSDPQDTLLDSRWGKALLGRVADSKKPVVLRAGTTENGFEGWAAVAAERGFEECVALPVVTNDVFMGTLVVCANEHVSFCEAEQSLLAEIAMDVGYGIQTLRARVVQEETARELSRAQERTRTIYNHLPDAIFVWRQKAGDFVLIDVNEVSRSATHGYVSSLLESPADALRAGIPRIERDLAHCVSEQVVIRREVQCVLPGADDEREMSLTYGFIPPDLVLLHARDVTEQRQTEKQLIVSQRLEAVGRLAGGVAHDFNNLLSVILSYSEFTLDQLSESDPIREDIEQIHEAGERAADLTRQLLAFSRRQVLRPRVVALNDAIDTIATMLHRLLGEDINIEVHRGEDVGNLIADPGQLEQVLMNLAVNARDAMPQGGKLTIETGSVDLDEEYAKRHVGVTPGPHVRLTVTDTGAGMDAETQNQIFDPFFTTKEEGKGTGLGLATVYGIVKQSGGHIWVYSEKGHGTSFKLYFPRVDAPVVEPDGGLTRVISKGDETILVVEDEDGVRNAAARILSGAGYNVLTAANGRKAIELVENYGSEIDLLLTDVVMPGMSGKELADHLAGILPHLLTLFMSGYTENAIVHHGVLNPDIQYIGKPFSVPDLTKKVREILDGR